MAGNKKTNKQSIEEQKEITQLLKEVDQLRAEGKTPTEVKAYMDERITDLAVQAINQPLLAE